MKSYNVKFKILLTLSAGFISLALFANSARAVDYFSFDDQTKKLTVSTSMLDMVFQTGAVVYIKDKTSGEVLVDTVVDDNNVPFSGRGFMSFASRNPDGNEWSRRPTANSNIDYSIISPSQVKLTYSPLYAGSITASQGGVLEVYFSVDQSTSEVIIQQTGTETYDGSDPRYETGTIIPITNDLPFMNFQKKSVISGLTKYSRNDPAIGNQSQFGGAPAPSFVVAEGDNSVLAAWSDKYKAQQGSEYIKIMHDPGYDHIILHSPQSNVPSDKLKISSSPWRIGTYNKWESAARRWRVLFEQNTGAKPLWENRAEWVRKIHAVNASRYWGNAYDYTQLASIVPPENLLYDLESSPTFQGELFWPTYNAPNPTEMSYVEKYKWPLIVYFPWTLNMSFDHYQTKLQWLKNNNYVPSDYKFTPDYIGANDPGFAEKSGEERFQDWLNYWEDINGNRSDESTVNRNFHAGSNKVQDYLVKYYADYCAAHNAKGAFFDTLAADEDYTLPDDKKIIEGQDYLSGMDNALSRLTRELPELAIRSEFQDNRVLPYAFYSWGGYKDPVYWKINNPLRTALVGSYNWGGGYFPWYAEKPYDVATEAILGTLPYAPTINYPKTTGENARLSQSIAKLFVKYELFNDLPANWDPEALAYYRSNTGNYFKFKQTGENTYAYIEEKPGGDQMRLAIDMNNFWQPPVRFNGSPLGDTYSRWIDLRLNTDENAFCRYSTTPGASYDNMTNNFSTDSGASGGLNHWYHFGFVSAGPYNYYVKCKDLAGNTNTDDYVINFNVGASTDGIAPVISDIQVTNITDTSATVTWNTNENSTTQVEFGLTNSYGGKTVIDSNPTSSHTVHLSGLPQNTTYHFKVKSIDSASNESSSGDLTLTTGEDQSGPVYSASDLNQDTKIDLTDFNILKSDFLRLTGSLANPRSDINGDGQATIRDVGIMMSGWR